MKYRQVSEGTHTETPQAPGITLLHYHFQDGTSYQITECTVIVDAELNSLAELMANRANLTPNELERLILHELNRQRR